MSWKHPDWLARLHDQCLVVAQDLQSFDQRVERRPIARGFGQRRVYDQILGSLPSLQYVLEHPEQALLAPAPASELSAALRDHAPWAAHPRSSPARIERLRLVWGAPGQTGAVKPARLA